MKIMMITSFIATAMMILFYVLSKMEKEEEKKMSTFECGFTSYFYSRFSFSIHYFSVGMIFLFLDLELCLMMPMMTEMEKTTKMKSMMSLFVSTLLLTLLMEWKEKKLEWKF